MGFASCFVSRRFLPATTVSLLIYGCGGGEPRDSELLGGKSSAAGSESSGSQGGKDGIGGSPTEASGAAPTANGGMVPQPDEGEQGGISSVEETGLDANTIVAALVGDLEGTLLAYSKTHGWPVRTANGYLFVSTDPSLWLLAGDHDGWAGTPMNDESGMFHWIELNVVDGTRYKFTDLATWESDHWSRSFNYDEYGEMSIVSANSAHLDRHFDVSSPELQSRTIRVWVPASTPTRTLYAHDGQNLFDPNGNWGGWHLHDSAPDDMLIVGIDNTSDRFGEYTPGTMGDAYADYVQHTVRGLVQEWYGEPGPVGVMGSSLGGLISLHIADRFPNDFTFTASLSGTLGWGSGDGYGTDTIMTTYVAAGHRNFIIYVDSGGAGTCFDSDGDGIKDDGDSWDNYCPNVQFAEAMAGIGYQYEADLFHWYEAEAEHNEAAWAARVWRPLAVFENL